MRRFLNLLVACVVCVTHPVNAAEIALFTDTSYVDYIPGNSFAEASNLQASLESQGHLIRTIAASTFLIAGAGSPLAGREALVFPSLSKGNPATVFSPTDLAIIANFVNNGGLLVVAGDGSRNGLNLLNTLFGWSLTSSFASEPLVLNTAKAADTPFEGGVSSLPTLISVYDVDRSSLPQVARAIYQGDGSSSFTFRNVSVFAVPVGTGWVIYLGWNWHDAAPTGTQDGGWLDVLDRAMEYVARLEIDATDPGPTGITIPDGTGTATSIINVPDSGQYSELEVMVGANHAWVGDLVMTLEKPDGSVVTLMDRPGVPSSTFGQSRDLQSQSPLVFNSGALVAAESLGNDCNSASVIDDTCTRILIPDQSLLESSPRSVTGTWTLRVSDLATGFTGSLINWRLSLLGVTGQISSAGIIVTPPQGLSTTEAGDSATFSMVLNSQPSADVTVELRSNDTSEGTVSPAFVTFTAGNWNIPQNALVTGVNDSAVDGVQPYKIRTLAAVSADPEYDGVNPLNVSVVNLDDEPDIYEDDDTSASARVILPTFFTTNQNHTLDSSGDEDWLQFYRDNYVSFYQFDLVHQGGSGNLVIELIDTDGTTVLCSDTVSVADQFGGGFDSDCAPEFDQVDIYFLRIRSEAPFTGVGPNYLVSASVDGAFESRIEGKISDTNTGLPLEAVILSATPQGSGNSAYKMTNLNGDYSIDLFPQLNPYTLSVTKPGFVTQQIPFTAPDLSVLTMDISLDPVPVPGITITPTSGLGTTEAGGTATFTAVLDSQPTASVSLGLNSNDLTEGTVSPSSLTFTQGNWDTPQPVTVTGENDSIADGNQTYTIRTTAATSADPDYNGVNPPDVSVTNQDDDTAGITVMPTTGLITDESGRTATFTVVLNSQPTASVSIGLSSSNPAEGTVSPASLLFATGNWNIPQMVTVTGVDDTVLDGDQKYMVDTAPASSGDTLYDLVNPLNVSVTNQDDEKIPSGNMTSVTAAVLPGSRSVQVGDTATAFGSIVNMGTATATSCGINLLSSISAAFSYQTTDAVTNDLTGTPDTPVDIPVGGTQAFVFAVTPSAPVDATEVQLSFDCTNTDPAATLSGLNTLLLSAETQPVPDIVSQSATINGDGIVHLPGNTGSGAFAVATVNPGSGGSVTAIPDTGNVPVPVQISICETNPANGVCLAPPAVSVTTTINSGATPTFAVFVTAIGSVPFDPALHRIFVRFDDAGGTTRGSTSVAVTTSQ